MIAARGRVPPAHTLSDEHAIPDIPDPIAKLPPLVRARPELENQFKLRLKPSTDETYKVETWAGCIPNNQVSLVSLYSIVHSLTLRSLRSLIVRSLTTLNPLFYLF